MSRGEELKKKFIEKQDKDKIESYKNIIHKHIDDALSMMEKCIDEDRDPVITIKLTDKNNNLITNPDMIPSYFEDILFHIILTEESEKNGLVADFRMGLDSIDNNPVQIPILVFTFK